MMRPFSSVVAMRDVPPSDVVCALQSGREREVASTGISAIFRRFRISGTQSSPAKTRSPRHSCTRNLTENFNQSALIIGWLVGAGNLSEVHRTTEVIAVSY